MLFYRVVILLIFPYSPAIAEHITSEHAPHGPEHTTQTYELHFTKGIALFDVGEYKTAREELTKALAAKPNDVQAIVYLARTNNLVKGYLEAEALLTSLLAQEPATKGARFDLGVAQFNLQKYEQALEQFSQAVKENPDTPLPYFYEGLTLNKLERYDQAPAKFARASLLDPELTASAHYQSGIAYFRASLQEEAEDAFNAVITAEPDSPLAQSSREFLTQVEKVTAPDKTKKKPWDLTLMVSPQYDTNVILQAPGGQRPEDISRQQDFKTTFYGRGEYRFKETEKMTLGSSYSFYQSLHTELTQFDVQAHSPTLFATYLFKHNIRARMEYKLDAFSLGTEPYLLAHSLNPMVMLAHTPESITQLQYRFQTKNFTDDKELFPENSDRDGDNNMMGLTHFHLFAEKQGNLRVSYSFDSDDTRDPTWDYHGHQVNIGITAPPWKTIRVDASFDYYRQNYLNANEFSPTLLERQDDIFNTSFTIAKPIGASYSVGLQYIYTRNKSNVSVFDFSRSIFALMANGQF